MEPATYARSDYAQPNFWNERFNETQGLLRLVHRLRGSQLLPQSPQAKKSDSILLVGSWNSSFGRRARESWLRLCRELRYFGCLSRKDESCFGAEKTLLGLWAYQGFNSMPEICLFDRLRSTSWSRKELLMPWCAIKERMRNLFGKKAREGCPKSCFVNQSWVFDEASYPLEGNRMQEKSIALARFWVRRRIW